MEWTDVGRDSSCAVRGILGREGGEVLGGGWSSKFRRFDVSREVESAIWRMFPSTQMFRLAQSFTIRSPLTVKF